MYLGVEVDNVPMPSNSIMTYTVTKAVYIELEKWYNENIEHPYPTEDDLEELGLATNLPKQKIKVGLHISTLNSHMAIYI